MIPFVTTRSRKPQLVRALVGVRRAGRRHPEDADLAAARLLLEEDLGPTVSRRLAAEVLGLSHTALQRWIDRGDIPVVFSEAGRMQIPVAALLELDEEVSAARAAGRRHVLEPWALRAQQRSERLPLDLLSDIETRDGGHRQPQLRGLAYHRAVSKRLTARMVADARQVLAAWEQEGRIDATYARLWRDLLAKPLPDVRRELAADTAQMADLRQNSPFAGMLSERERRAVLAVAAAEMP
ncbi:MAG: hypothetical protein NVS1B3_16810 [Candidatus Dormibacteraceae bacterium]